MSKKQTHREKFLEEGRALMVEEWEALAHALHCEACGLAFQGNLALALVGWNEGEWWQAVVASGKI